MSRFSLRIPDQSFLDLENEIKIRASFRYDKIQINDDGTHAQQLAQARAKHRQRLIKPLHSNLKLKRVLADKAVMHNNSENSIKAQKGSNASLIKAGQIDHILHTIREVTQISAFQDKRMGLTNNYQQRPIPTDSTFDTKISGYSPTSGGMSEGQKLREKAINLCRKKAEHQEAVIKAKNKSVTNAKATPDKQESITKPGHKQLKNDIRFRYSNRRVLLLRTLSQIADKKNVSVFEKENYHDEGIVQRKTQGENRRASLTYVCQSPARRPSYDELKTDSTQAGIYLTEVTTEAPQVKSLNSGINPQPRQKNVQKIYKKLCRKDSMLSNCSIMDKSSELNGHNPSQRGSLNLDAFRGKVPDQKGNKVPKTLTVLPTRSISSLSRILPTVPSSHRGDTSMQKPISTYKGYLHEGFSDNMSSLNHIQSNQDLLDCLNELQQQPRSMLRKNKSQKPTSKSRGLYTGMTSRNSLKDDKSRHEEASFMRLRRSVPAVKEESYSKVYSLLHKIHKQTPKGKRKNETRFESSLETIEKVEESRNDTNESNVHWKMMHKGLQDVINASYQDTQETSLAEASILTK